MSKKASKLMSLSIMLAMGTFMALALLPITAQALVRDRTNQIGLMQSSSGERVSVEYAVSNASGDQEVRTGYHAVGTMLTATAVPIPSTSGYNAPVFHWYYVDDGENEIFASNSNDETPYFDNQFEDEAYVCSYTIGEGYYADGTPVSDNISRLIGKVILVKVEQSAMVGSGTARSEYEDACPVTRAFPENAFFLSDSPYTYDPTSPQTSQAPTLTSTSLTLGIDYSVSYINEDGTALKEGNKDNDGKPIRVGSYKVIVSGIGEYVGAIEQQYDFSIVNPKFSVLFLDDDGTTVLKAATAYDYGTPAADIEKPADPTKTATNQYTYSFSGWEPEVAAVTGNATYTATYTSTINEYTIKFVNCDGTELESRSVAYNEVPVYSGETPTKVADAQFTYTFAGWSPEISSVNGNATYTATYTSAVNNYTVRFVNDDGTDLQSSLVAYGDMPSYTSQAPTKAADAQYTYTFAGWSPEITSVTGDVTYTAYYSSTVNKYTVTFVDENGAELESGEVPYGTTPQYTGALPTKAATAQYTYTFDGWTPEFTAVTGDATYTATYTSAVINYMVKFVNDDGTELQSGLVAYGETPVYSGETPTKATDTQYTYTFSGWSSTIVEVTGDATYTATYSSTLNSYSVTFVDENGAILKDAVLYLYGTSPDNIEKPADPTKSADAQYTYTFAGWTPAITEVTEVATYRASYTNETNKYTIKFVNEDGTVLQSSSVAYGAIPSYTGETPVKGATAQYSYTFFCWSPAIAEVTGDATYTATYTSDKRSYSITWKQDDGTIIDTTMVEYGFVPTHEAPTKEATSQYTYTFSGWTPELATVTGDATYTATYSSSVNKYKVTFVDENGKTVLKAAAEYDYGTAAADIVKPDNPTKSADAQYTYTFAGWTPEITSVNGNATYKATYTSTVNKYSITFVDEDGTTVLKAATEYDYGTTATDIAKPATPSKEADTQYSYTFAGWSPEVTSVTGAATYKATYTSTVNKYSVTFVDEDGSTVLKAATEYDYGTTADSIVAPSAPTKDGTAQYSYSFAGWTPSLSSVTGDVTYKATYFESVNLYTITWKDDAGNTLYFEQINYGEAPIYNGETPVKTSTDQYNYVFAGWSPDVALVSGNATYTATFTPTTRSYDITWKQDGGSIIAEFSYTFSGWTPSIATVTGEATYTATYTATRRSYSATFKSDPESHTITVTYGEAPTLTWTPAKSGYRLLGWKLSEDSETLYGTSTHPFPVVTGDVTYNAVFGKLYSISVSNNSEHGSVVVGGDKTQAVAGEVVNFTVTESVAGYKLSAVAVQGNSEVESVTLNGTGNGAYWFYMPEKDVTITATFLPLYTVTFDLNGKTVTSDIPAQSVMQGDKVYEPSSPSAEGYTFAGWYREAACTNSWGFASDTVTENTTLYAKWTPNSSTAYKVEHYQQNITSDGYTLADTDNKTGTTGAQTAATARSYQGFTAQPFEQKAIAADGSTIIEIRYTRNEYTLTFDSNGGSSVSGITAKFGAQLTQPSSPSKEGYTFTGWNPSFPETMPLNGATLTAQWAPSNETQYKVEHYKQKLVLVNVENPSSTDNYDLVSSDTETKQGTTDESTAASPRTYSGFTDQTIEQKTIAADGSTVVKVYYNRDSYTVTFDLQGHGAAIDPQAIRYEGKATAPSEPSAFGYTFGGWYKEATCLNAWGFTSDTVTVTTALYAKWETISYTITYDGLSGSSFASTNPNPTAYNIASDDITLNIPTKTGYSFAGWSGTNLDSATTSVTIASGSTGNRSYTANWSPITYTVQFHANNGSGEMASQSFTYDVGQVLTTNTFTREGYDFAGWATSASGEKVYENAASVSNLTSEANGVVSLYAVWSVKSYNVTISSIEHGSINADNTTATYGSEVTLSATPAIGYHLKDGSWTVSRTGAPETTVTVTGGKFTMPAYDVTVSAAFEASTYTLSFDANGGTVDPASKTVTYGVEYGELPVPTREGMIFLGWYTAGDEQVMSSDIVAIAADHTLHAHWASVSVPESTIYNGKSQVPSVTVMYGETQLVEGTDYTLNFKRGNEVTSDFTNPGTIKVIVTSKAYPSSILEKGYVITKAAATSVTLSPQVKHNTKLEAYDISGYIKSGTTAVSVDPSSAASYSPDHKTVTSTSALTSPTTITLGVTGDNYESYTITLCGVQRKQ